MRRTRFAVLLAAIILAVAAPAASAHGSASGHSRDHHHHRGWWRSDIPGVLPAWARVDGHSLKDFIDDWNVWGFGSSEDNPILAVRCEPSPLDPRVWYMPVSLGGDTVTTCDIPRGAFLFQDVGSAECSDQEQGTIWYGADVPALRKCVRDDFKLISYAELTIDGWTTTDLHRHVATSRATNLPANNLISPNPAVSMQKGYFLLYRPMRPGTHTIHAYDEFGSLGFAGGITYTINVH